MEINATLLVQCGHFILAWILLKKILLQPTLQIIDYESTEKESLVHAIKEEQKVVLKQEQEKSDAVQKYRYYFSQHAPRIKEYRELFFFEPVSRVPLVKSVDKKNVQETIEEVKDDLVKKLKRVRS